MARQLQHLEISKSLEQVQEAVGVTLGNGPGK